MCVLGWGMQPQAKQQCAVIGLTRTSAQATLRYLITTRASLSSVHSYSRTRTHPGLAAKGVRQGRERTYRGGPIALTHISGWHCRLICSDNRSLHNSCLSSGFIVASHSVVKYDILVVFQILHFITRLSVVFLSKYSFTLPYPAWWK